MKNTILEVDQYIDEAADFARPILKRLRKLFHQASPKIEESIKWGAPHFEYKGIVGSMAAFKSHVGFGFWKEKLLTDPRGLLQGHNGSRVTSMADLPDDEDLLHLIREAVALNEQGVTVPRPARRKVARPTVPDVLRGALAKNAKAKQVFEGLSPSCQREYIEWILEAKQEATRERRLATTVEWLTEGKSRHWKYAKK